MKSAIEELESPYLDDELAFSVPTCEWRDVLTRAVGESPFASFQPSPGGAEAILSMAEVETGDMWPDEEDAKVEDLHRQFATAEAELFGETDQEWIDVERVLDDPPNSEQGEVGQWMGGEEESAVDEAFAFPDEAEPWIPGDDLMAADDASLVDHDDELDSGDGEAVSEVEDESPKAGSTRPGVVSNKDSLSVTIILDQPAELDDKFQLVGGGGSIIKSSDAQELVAGEKIIRFKVRPDKQGYKLIHHRSKGASRPIFLAMRIQDLTKAAIGPKTSEDAYARIDSQVPRKLPGRHRTDGNVDIDLVQRSPVLVDLKVKDPEL